MYNPLKKYTKRFLFGTYTKDFFQPCKETLQRKIRQRQRQVSFHFIVDSKSKNKMVLKGI
jgi:hypothetical protein